MRLQLNTKGNGMSTERKKRLLESRRDEKDEAARWLADHPGLGELPSARKRSETGESNEPDSFSGLSGGGGDRLPNSKDRRLDNDPGLRGHGHLSMNTINTYDTGTDLEQWEQWHNDNGSVLVFLGSQPSLTPEQVVTRARVEHLLSYMLPEHAELLMRYHGQRETQDALAAEHHVSRQAIQQRLRVAEEDFRRVFVEHWQEEVELF